jgi:hypothetical protein
MPGLRSLTMPRAVSGIALFGIPQMSFFPSSLPSSARGFVQTVADAVGHHIAVIYG